LLGTHYSDRLLSLTIGKVIIAGSSAGSDAAAYNMLAYGGALDQLFRGAFLSSGAATAESPVPYPNYTVCQNEYNNIVNLTR
jgi:carboxylesterase type B